MTTSPDLGIPYIANQQSQPEVTHNDALNMLIALQKGAIDKDLNAPPGSPTDGDVYIVGTAPTGAWSGKANKIAIYTTNAWTFVPGNDSSGTNIAMGARHEGMRIWVQDENAFYVWSGAAWTAVIPALPISIANGGTGQDTAVEAIDALSVKGADIASAATTNLAGATGDFVDVTGTTTITALGTAAAGVERVVRFTGSLTLTHNATSLILPGAVNITTVAGDVARFRSLGSGNWVCVGYSRSDGGAISAALPIARGGTGQTTAVAAIDALSVKGADIASAATTDLSAATGDFVDVTGTTTITALGTAAAGVERVVRFTGALTLTHNATSLILPTGASITTAAGDVARFRSLGSGNWVCVNYSRANGQALAAGAGVTAIANGGTGQTTAVEAIDALSVKGADIASAATTDLSAATGDFVDVTGTTTITALGTSAAGVERTVRFTGILTLTHNATSLILPGGVNRVTAAGDIAVFRSLGSGNWVCVEYTQASLKTYTPTLTPASGSFTSASATGTYFEIGNIVFFTITITITTNGTAAGNIAASLPFNASANGVCFGREANVIGVGLGGSIASGANLLYISKSYDNSYPGGDGYGLLMSGFYFK